MSTEPSWRQHHSLFLSSGIGSGCRGIIIMDDAEVSGDMKRERLTAVVSIASESVPRVSNFSCISLRSHENSTATGSGCCCTRQQHKQNQIAGDNCARPSDVIVTEAIGRHIAVWRPCQRIISFIGQLTCAPDTIPDVSIIKRFVKPPPFASGGGIPFCNRTGCSDHLTCLTYIFTFIHL